MSDVLGMREDEQGADQKEGGAAADDGEFRRLAIVALLSLSFRRALPTSMRSALLSTPARA